MTSCILQPARVAAASVVMMLALAALAGCSFQPDEEVWEISGPVFGTSYHISVVLPEDRQRLEALAQGIDDALEEVDASMSTWREDSELSKLNRLKDQSDWTPVSESLFEVLARSDEISRLTDGAFDVTIGPVVNLWGFGPDARPEHVPSDEDLARALASTGFKNLSLQTNPPAVKASKTQYIDLSAIAKGYGVDVVARYLDSEGVKAYLVEIGGEVRTQGKKPNGGVWRLAIEQPAEGGEQKVSRIITLPSRAMATSGDYRNYYESEGRRFSHTIDPETGKPITHNLASVTVITDDSMSADALATGFTVMGYERAAELATRENIAAYFIVRTENGFETHQTPAFSSYITQ
ncbi:FAD:protein FMN transferase [Marinobacter sp. AC-23]|uniref:FAD:protein FMN transferase n=1 Tax=Marinobacter sp. AC-23 TaxID=1879031 RepID=UPI0008DDCB81|nr:FAD:protein FMN transferase [Marinobacter sp. AC-23]OHY73095.1 FAD:protein FMN transferase ApbE [Marinobacter sp. AC-23]